jgi:hypothetical protein
VLDVPPRRIPDGDAVPAPGYRTYREILAEPTRVVPVVPAPLVRPYVNDTEHVGRHRWWKA